MTMLADVFAKLERRVDALEARVAMLDVERSKGLLVVEALERAVMAGPPITAPAPPGGDGEGASVSPSPSGERPSEARIRPGDEVDIIDGLGEGGCGRVVSYARLSDIGVKLFTVDVRGQRQREIREDFMRRREPAQRTSEAQACGKLNHYSSGEGWICILEQGHTDAHRPSPRPPEEWTTNDDLNTDEQRTNDARPDRDREIWEARKRGETVAELGTRYDVKRERITQICAREQSREQKRCDDFGCRQGVHEPPCPLSDPDELALCPGAPRVIPIAEGPNLFECGECGATNIINSSAPASPTPPLVGDVLTSNSGDRGDTRIVATATAAQGPGSGDGGERPALSFEGGPQPTRIRPDQGGIDGEVWITLDAQKIAVGIFRDRDFAEEDAKTYGDASWHVTGPYLLRTDALVQCRIVNLDGEVAEIRIGGSRFAFPYSDWARASHFVDSVEKLVNRPRSETAGTIASKALDMTCRLCLDPCRFFVLDADSSTWLPGYCVRHGDDMLRPLTTPTGGERAT